MADPARYLIILAIARMTVVVEAAARSGSLITADLAADLGRDLGAVPGPVTSRSSAGPNNLLAGGACVIRDAQDVLDAMLGPGVRQLPTGDCRGADAPDLTYTAVGTYGDARIPYVTAVKTRNGPLAALDLVHRAFEADDPGDPELRIVALFEGEPQSVDFDRPGRELG